MSTAKKRIIILGFGGTIAMVPDANGILKPAKNIDENISIVPTLRENADIQFEQIENLFQLGNGHFNPPVLLIVNEITSE